MHMSAGSKAQTEAAKILAAYFPAGSALLSAHAIEGVAIPSRPTKLMRRPEGISEAAAYANLFD